MTNRHMETRLLQVDPRQPQPDRIEQAAAVLRAGGLVAFPTETVYGLGANALDPAAVARIFAAKERPASDPLIVHLHSLDQLGEIARDVSPLALALAAAFWAGPLTLVLPRHPSIPASVSAGRETVAVRMPAHPVALALLRAAAVPVAAPSANRFSRPSPTSATHVLADLDGRVDLILDAGNTPVGVESTVLDLTQTPPQVLRPGGISLEVLREHLPDVIYSPRYLKADEDAAAPGMLLRHYSPSAALILYRGTGAVEAMMQQARAEIAAGKRVGILTVDEAITHFESLEGVLFSLGSREDAEQMAQHLFAGLRTLDEQGVDVILAHSPAENGIGLAIYDRLLRAAEGHVVETDR